MGLYRLVSDFYPDVGVSLEVVVPVRVSWGASLLSEHNLTLTIAEEHHRVDSGFPAAGPYGVEEQQGRPLEVAADLAVFATELGDRLRVEVSRHSSF
jgi:hypothetical protein